MKTKAIIIMMIGVLLFSSCSKKFDEQDARALVRQRVPNAVRIQEFNNGSLSTVRLYAAITIDSGYTASLFKVSSTGAVEKLDQVNKQNNLKK